MKSSQAGRTTQMNAQRHDTYQVLGERDKHGERWHMGLEMMKAL